MPIGHRRRLFRNSHWGGGRASGAARGRPRSECRDGHEDLRRIVRIGHERAPPAERELQRHFSGSDPLWRFRLEASSTDPRLHKREPFGLRMPMYGERRHFLQFRPPTLPLVDRTRNVPFEKRLRIPRVHIKRTALSQSGKGRPAERQRPKRILHLIRTHVRASACPVPPMPCAWTMRFGGPWAGFYREGDWRSPPQNGRSTQSRENQKAALGFEFPKAAALRSAPIRASRRDAGCRARSSRPRAP